MRHRVRVFCDARLADGLCFLIVEGGSGGVVVLVERGLVEQRHVAVLDVLDRVPVVEVAARAGCRARISIGEELIRVHSFRHDRTREHGALANPGGRPNRINAAS